MSLLEAQRQRHKALNRRHGLGASEVIRQLRHDFVQETGGAAEAGSAPRSAAHPHQLTGPGFRPREDATTVASARAEEIQGLFKTTKKKTNVLEVVRGVVSDIQAQEQKDVDQVDKSRKNKFFKASKRRLSDLHGDDIASLRVFGSLLGDGLWETCAACINAWQNWFRRVKFERNRQSMRAALAWDDPARATAVMRARETLAKSDQVTWLSVQFCRKVNEDKLQSSVYPVTSPPRLRRESGDIFSALAQELREQLAELLRQQMSSANEAERGVVQRWIIKEKTKDVKKVEERDEAASWQLECAKRKLHQSPALAALFQQLYIASLAFSVEKTATTLTQMFSDTSYLRIRIMAVPFANEENGQGEAMIVTSPNHNDVQAHLNALLESVVAIAGRAPIVWQPRKMTPNAENAGEEIVAEMARQKDKDASDALQRSLVRSATYHAAVQGLDAQLRHSFQVVERRLQGLQRQLDPMLLAQSAVLSRLYLDRRGLFDQILLVADKDRGPESQRIPPECEPESASLASPFLADFVMFWLSRPQQLERQGLPEKLSVLLMNLFYSLAQVVASSKTSLPIAPLQSDMAACLSPYAGQRGRVAQSAVTTIIADAVDGKGGGCASFHTALASVVDGSGSFLELLLRPEFLLHPEQFLRIVLGSSFEMSVVEGLCEWLKELQRSCEQWERAIQNTRALSQCGPFALDMRYFSFIAEQTSPALLSLSTYALNIYGVNCGKRLWKDIYELVLRFRKPVVSFEDMVGELELLSNVYQNLENFRSDRRQLTPLIACLVSVTRSRLFTERLADVRAGRSGSVEHLQERFLLDFQDEDEELGQGAPLSEAESAERREKGRAHGVGHPYGGLSTGTLQYLCLKTDDVFKRLQESVEKVLETLPERFGPFQELVREESLAVAEAARATREELEEQLSPCGSLAIDARCSLTRVGAAEDAEQENSRHAKKDAKVATLQLTAGGLSSFFDVQSALSMFEQRYRQLDGRNQLMNRFQDLAKSDPSVEPRPANQCMEELRHKLQDLRVFWKAAQEWDKEVEKRLRQSPVLVCIADLQRQAHFTLRAVSQCPKEHQKLLRQRINAFRQVFRQLFMVQSIMCLNAKGDPKSDVEEFRKQLVPYSPPQAHVWSNLFDTPVNIKPRDFSANCFGFEATHEKRGGDAAGDAPGFDPNDTMTSLGRLLRAGVLDKHAKVARQYALASRESQEMRSLLCNVIAWSQQRLPISLKFNGPVLPAASVLAEQLDSQSRQLETALRRSRPYPQLFNRQDGEIASEENPPSGEVFFLGGFYKNLAETWLRRFRLMRQNLGTFIECQDLWLKLSPLLKISGAVLHIKELQRADGIFQRLAQSMAANPEARACLEDVLGSADGSAMDEACKFFAEAYTIVRQDLQELRSRCFRLFYLEDEVLLELCGSPANPDTQQQIVSRCLPQLFPGWSKAIFARQLVSAGTPSGLEQRTSSKRIPSKRMPVHSDLVITAAQPTGPALQLLEAVPLHLPVQEWLYRLEEMVAKSFAAALRQESPHHWRSKEINMLRCQIEKQSFEQSNRDHLPEHVDVTAERIRWTYIVEAWANLPEAIDLLMAYVEHRVKEEVARNNAIANKESCAGAVLTLMLELRQLLSTAKEHQQEAQELKFLRMAWRSAESLAVELGPLILEFGWELYGGDELICPATERCYVELSQHLSSLTCPVLQGSLGSTVTRAFAACCGIACHQCYILEPGQFRFCTGAGLLGHWVILHGIHDLEQQPREAYLKFLSKFFQQLSQSLEFFRDKMIDDPLLHGDFLSMTRVASTNPSRGLHFAKLPPGSMKVHDVPCTFDSSKLLISRTDRGRATSFSFEGGRHQEVALDMEFPRRAQSCPAKQTIGGSGLEFEVKAHILGGIPRTMHPAAALFIAPGPDGHTVQSGRPLRNLSFPPADLTLYIHAGLIRIGILDMDAARMLTRAVSAFNTFSGAEVSKSKRKGRHPHISIGEIQSICAFAASLRRAHTSHGDLEERTKTLDEQILCEAWMCAIGTQLDAGAQREMLWRCTVMSFGHSACFATHQQAFRQNLFNDTLMAQRVAKKDLSTRFYIQIADTLRQKFSFDFYNPMVVQKCIATTQALLNDRDVAVVGDAGAGKTDCIMTLLEAAEDFPDDFGRPLFPRVKLVRINTLAHSAEGALLVVSKAAEAQKRRTTIETDDREDCIWLALDGPMNPELFEAVSSALPLTINGINKPYLPKARAFRIIVETDNLAQLSPATASSLAVTYIDTERGPTWKDRAMAWTHRFVLTCPEYAHFMELTKELLMHLMDSILAFVLYYFHFNPSEISAAATEGEALDYRHQTTCFLSCFTSLLVDPVVEKQLIAATKEGEEALERQVRLLIGMSSISAFGASLFTSQRPRFERYIRENVLDPIHANTFPPLYDLYLDSKTGQFQAVGKIVHLTEPIVEAHNICVATEEFVAFQLRLRRLLAINAPVLLAGTAGSGKSALLRYLHGCKSPSTAGLLRRCPDLGAVELQQALTPNLSAQGTAGVLAPGNEKRLVVFIDDLHLSSIAAASWRLQAVGQQYQGPGASGQSCLGEWIRFALESQGFYRMEDGHFVAIRDTSFLPSLLAPNSQNLEVCKRFTRHFFLAFMEIPSEASIQKIFSTILTLNLTVGIPEEVMQNLTRNFWPMKLHPNVEIDTPGQKLAAQLLQATLAVWAETDLASKHRLHGLARVFWDVAHAFSRVPVEDLHSQVEVGYLWAFVMRTSVLDALLLPEAASHRRRVYGAVARSCAGHFGLLLGGKAGLEDPDLQALELDCLAFSAIADGQVELNTPGLRTLRRVNLVSAREGVLQRIGSQTYVNLQDQLDTKLDGETPSQNSEETEEGFGEEDSEVHSDEPHGHEAEGHDAAGEFSIDRKFKNQRPEDTEQAAPDPELLTIDNEASLMWLLDEQTLCTLLRLSHVLTTYPITCLVGGWTHLPLLGLAGKVLAGSSGGEALHFCTNVTAESLERELMKSPSAIQQSRRKPQKVKAAQKKVEAALRVLTISEEDFPAQAPEAYLEREQSRFFRPGGGALGRDDEKSQSSDDVEEDGQKRLVVICRSPASLQELFTRCGFLRQTLVATFNVLPPLSLQQVALVYLGNRLTSKIDLSALPKPQKKLLMHKSYFRGHQGARASVKKSTKGAMTDDGQLWQQQLFIPLAKIVESLHLRIRDVLAFQLGKDVALEFCSASRFSMFVQSIARLAMHHRSVQNHRGTLHESVRNRLKALEKYLVELDTKLRSMHVSLKLLAEESRRLLSRSAREHELQTSAMASLAKVRERKNVVQSHIAAVDARHGNDFEKALSTASSSLRQFKQLERSHFESLAQYQHLPAPLVRALGAAKAVLLHINGEEDPEDAAVPIFKRRLVPSAALAAATAAAGGAQIGVPKVSRTPTRAETFEWANTLANPLSLRIFDSWDGSQPLPGWLAEVLQRFLLSPDCHPSNLWSMSPAASRLSQWLRARLECHRVLMRMEDDRQSMGDLSSQLAEVTGAVKAAEAELQRAEETLERLQAAHAETVQKRQLLLRSEAVLQRQSARATRVLEIAAPRRRECEVVVPLLRDAEESPEQWGAILTIGVLSCYGACFGHALRQPIMKELQQVLQEGGVPTPSNLYTSAYLGNFFPQTFLQKAIDTWPNSQLLQGTVAAEASGSLCTLMFDPFGNALEWLKELHTQRNPVASGGGDKSEFDKHLQRLMESRGIARDPGVADGDVAFEDSENEWEDVPQAKASDQDCVQPMMCSGSETPEALTSKLQHCMLEGQIMIVQLEDLSSLRGFVGTLLVLLSGSHSQVRLTTERHSVLFNLSQRFTRALAINAGDVTGGIEAESEELRVRVFSMLQRLEAALPMVHYRFHLYVMAPRCPWSRCLWGPAKTKQAEQLMKLPPAIWSSCTIISMDPLPAQPAQAFLPCFMYAKEAPNAARKRQEQNLTLMAQETRLLVSEELILHLLGKMENADMQSDKVVRPLQKFNACASRLAASVSMGLQERQQRRKSEKKFLPFASTVALLQCALIDSELAAEAVKGLFLRMDSAKDDTKDLTKNVNKEVDGFAMRPLVLQVLLQHQLKLHSSAKDAVSELMEMVFRGLGPSHSSLLRLFLLLESREQGLTSLWNSMVSAIINPSTTLETSRSERRQSMDAMKTTEVDNGASASDEGKSEDEDDKSSESSDDDDDDDESEEENQGVEEEGQEDENQEEEEVDSFTEDDVLEVVPATKILSVPFLRRMRELWSAVKATVPTAHPKRTAKQQLARVPSKTPLLVPCDALPLFRSLAKSLEVRIQEISLVDQLQGGLEGWLLYDLAECKDFRELEALLVAQLQGVRRKKTGRRGAQVQTLIAGQAVAAALFREMLEGQEQPYQEPTRWILYCSAATAEIPKSILRHCFCIQNVMAFFGVNDATDVARLQSDLVEDGAEMRKMQSTASSTGSAPQVFDFTLVGRDERFVSVQLKEALSYIIHRHPLLTVCSSSADEKQSHHLLSSMMASIKVTGLQNLSFLNGKSLSDWVEESLLVTALPWAQERRVGAVLQAFSPTLTHRSDGETYHMLGALSMKISGFLQQLASAETLTLDSPFWLCLELSRAIRALQDARRECIACHAALAGDASWTAQLYAVYKSAQLGMSHRANRPLASWLASWAEHVNFLSNWDPKSPLDSKPFRLASVSEISIVLSSYYREGGLHHLWFGESAVEKHPSQDAPKISVEGLRLVGARWANGSILQGGSYEDEVPPAVIHLSPGALPPGPSQSWYLCPLVVSSADAFGADLVERPVAHVYVRTSTNPALCALHGVRLVCSA